MYQMNPHTRPIAPSTAKNLVVGLGVLGAEVGIDGGPDGNDGGAVAFMMLLRFPPCRRERDFGDFTRFYENSNTFFFTLGSLISDTRYTVEWRLDDI